MTLLGGNVSGPDERLIEVYDPETQRFESTGELAAIAWIHEAARLPDGRIIVASGESGIILVAADAASSERPADRPRGRGQPTVTALDDGRAVIIGRGRDEPAKVTLFDSSDDIFEAADPMKYSREDHAAVLLHDGTVMVVGGMGCDQTRRASAEIWNPEVMAVVAAGDERVCEPSASGSPPPAELGGAASSGGRIEVPGAAFAVTFPEAWSVELADPDADVFTAEPGTAWEALRAVAPERSTICSVFVGVASVPLDSADGHGTGIGEGTVTAWGSDEPWRLVLPALDEDAGWTSFSETSEVRLRHDGIDLDHHQLYSLACSADERRMDDPDGVLRDIMESFELLPWIASH